MQNNFLVTLLVFVSLPSLAHSQQPDTVVSLCLSALEREVTSAVHEKRSLCEWSIDNTLNTLCTSSLTHLEAREALKIVQRYRR